jgi:hypothetical protein
MAELATSEKVRTLKPLRRSYTGGPIQVFSGFGRRPKLTVVAKQNIVMDFYEEDKRLSAEKQLPTRENKERHRKRTRRSSSSVGLEEEEERPGQPKGPYLLVAEHYGVAKQTVYDIIKHAREESKLDNAERPGAPVLMTQEVRNVVVQTFNACNGRITIKGLAKKLQGKVNWKSSRKGKILTAPSTATISRLMNDPTIHIGVLRVVPTLNEKAIEERKAFPAIARLLNDDFLCTHDEAYVQVRVLKGRMIMDLSLQLNEQDEAIPMPVEQDGGGQAAPKIFLFGSYSKPRVVRILGKLYFDPDFDGRVALFRIRGVRARKVKRLDKQKGDPIFENVTINGARYKQIFEMTDGFFDYIDMYFDPSRRPHDYSTAKVLSLDLEEELESQPQAEGPLPRTRVWCQEDGAPGHGYDNIHNKGTVIHQELVQNAALRGVKLFKQPRHSPEMNAMDLGGWRMLKRAVENRSDEVPYFDGRNSGVIEAKIWEIAKDEWLNNYDPMKVFLIFEQRRILMDEMERANGGNITVEPHTGLRKKFKNIRNDPAFVRSMRLSDPEAVELLRDDDVAAI